MGRWLRNNNDYESYRRKLANIRAYGGRNSAGVPIDSVDPMFDKRGEVNAWDKQDLFNQMDKFQGLRSKYPASAFKKGSTSLEDQQRVIEQAMASPQNWMKFGQEMVPLILRELDYEGFIRNVFFTHNVSFGKIVKYEKDINVTALVVSDDSQTIESRVKGTRVFPPDFGVSAMPVIPLKEIAVRDYDVVDRARDKATFQIMLKEDRNGLRLLYQGAQIENNIINIAGSTTKATIESIVHEVEQWGLIVDKLIMNRTEFGELRSSMNSMDYDPLTSREAWLSGIFTNFWGMKVMVVAGKSDTRLSVPSGMIFATTAPRFLGGMGIRQELQSYPADRYVMGEAAKGFLFYELITQALVNPRAVAVGMKASTVIPAWMTE